MYKIYKTFKYLKEFQDQSRSFHKWQCRMLAITCRYNIQNAIQNEKIRNRTPEVTGEKRFQYLRQDSQKQHKTISGGNAEDAESPDNICQWSCTILSC